MKYKILGLLVLTFLASSFKSEEGIKWLDFNKGYATAVKKKKIMIVDVYTDWCGWCKRMDRDTYTKAAIIEAVNSDFIPVKFNPEQEGITYTYNGNIYTGDRLARAISNNRITGFPTTIFLYPKGDGMEVVSGYKNPEQLTALLNDMKKKFYGK